MKNQENIIYKNLLEKLKILINGNANTNEIKQLLVEIDNIISNISVSVFDEDFLLPFYMLLEKKMENSTIGEELLNSYLTNKEKLPSSLLMYFYMKQKDKMGFKDSYNRFKIGNKYIACTDHYDDKYMYFNFEYHVQNYPINDEFNYQCMENIMHEIVHIYQFSIKPNSENIYDKLIYNDRQLWELSNEAGIMNYGALHDEYLIEHQANVWSRHFMVLFAKKQTNYFNASFVEKKTNEFLKKLNRNFNYGGQRKVFPLIMKNAIGFAQDILSEEERGPKFEDNKKRIEELLANNIYLTTYIKNNPDVQELDRHIYLGFESYSLEEIEKMFYLQQRSIAK